MSLLIVVTIAALVLSAYAGVKRIGRQLTRVRTARQYQSARREQRARATAEATIRAMYLRALAK